MREIIGYWLPIAVVLQFGVLASSAQTGTYLFRGSQTTITLSPGLYDITVYGAQGASLSGGGGLGGLGAEMEGEFYFSAPTTLTLLVGGAGHLNPSDTYLPGGGGGGSFVVHGATPLVVAGGGGGGAGIAPAANGGGGGTGSSGGSGGGYYGGAGGTGGGGGQEGGGSAISGGGGGGYYGDGVGGYNGSGGGASYLTGGTGGSGGPGGNGGFGGGGGGGDYGGGGGGGYSGGGGGSGGYAGSGGGGGGGGSYIDATAIAVLTQVSGVASPDGAPSGQIIITAVPEPTTLALVSLCGLSLLLLRRKVSEG